MSVFRKGDRIICTNIKGAQYITLNKAYTVIEPFSDYVSIICDTGENSVYVDFRFKSIAKERKEKLEKLNETF